MPSAYLQTADLATYGVSGATAQQITAASQLIDSYLYRPAGMVYTAGVDGTPVYMSALAPELSFTASAGFGPGSNVVIPVTGPTSLLEVGDCIVIDRANASVVESCQVIFISGNQLTLASVQYTHATSAVLETGLLIQEKRYAPKNRTEIVLSMIPVVRVVGGTGRYGYGRRGDQASYNMDNFNLLASLSKFGGPPAWEIWPANTAAGIDPGTGMLWVPAGVMLAYYSEIKVRYVAGFTYAALPSGVKQACANIINTQVLFPELNGNIQTLKTGAGQITRFKDTVLDADTRAMLDPYKARLFG